MGEKELTPQQQAVVENRDGTLLVSAAAGSGKTKVLVDRVMDRIINRGKNIHEFLIITFTNAAAAELRGKINEALGKAMAADPGNKHLSRQLNLISMAQISTVHAFCGSLIRQYGYLLEVPSDYAMLEDAHREVMLDRILEDVLEERYEAMTPGFQLLTDTLGGGRSDSGLVDLVKNVFEKLLSQPYPERWLKTQCLTLEEQTELTETVWGRILLEDAKRQLSWLIDRYTWAISVMQGDEKLSPKYLPAYENQKKSLERMMDAMDGPWDAIAPAMEMEYATVRVVKYPDPELLEQIKAVKNDGKKVLDKLRPQFARPAGVLIAEQNALAPALEALLGLVGDLYERFSREKRRKNLLDFSDQEHLAIRLLVQQNGRPTEVAREVSQQFTEIMVDEYQDSNRVQELIYTAISGEDDRNRFLVGDVKQSIYSFRQAEPELFLSKYQTYTPGETAIPGEKRYLVLSKNFRSRPEILTAANHVFQTVMGPELGGLRYEAQEMLYPGLKKYPQDGQKHVEFSVLSFPKGENGRDDDSTKYHKEAQWVANRIVSLLREGVPVREGSGTRPVKPQDIAILFRSRDPMGLYARALTQAGVPVASDSGDDLFETPEVQVLLNLLRVLDNPHQDIPLLSVLCGSMFHFSNEMLARIRLHSKSRRFYDALTESDAEFSKTALAALDAMREKARTLSADALVWYLLHDGGLLGAYSAMDGGEARRKNLLTVYDLARKASGGTHLYLYELVRYLERQAENGLQIPGEGTGGVILTTIHKSKGLEYPVVFLCDLSRKFNFRELGDMVLVDGEDGLGAKITDLDRRIRYPGLAYDALKVKKRRKLLSEELRVLYVAMTRPKDYLFMTYSSAQGVGFLKKLLPGAGCPAEPWAASGASCLGDWVLLGALNQVEAGELFAESGRPWAQLCTLEHPWNINFREIEQMEALRYTISEDTSDNRKTFVPEPDKLVEALQWQYAHADASILPSKLTATQLKGRDKDQEAAENSPSHRSMPQIQRPEFILTQTGLNAAEKGTAAHLFLQYARFADLSGEDGVVEELDRMVDEKFLTEQQAEAVDPQMILRLFRSELGQRMLNAENLIREFKFSILVDAKEYYPGLGDEQLLLQGVVDAAMVEEDGIVIVDFKTDRVTEQSVSQRAKEYAGQLETYKKAISRIFELPVKETILYFLYIGKEMPL